MYDSQSRTYRLPVIYVFGKKSIEVDDCVRQLLQILNLDPQQQPTSSVGEGRKNVVFRHDVGYAHGAG
jgi:diphthamide biosynthesis protein 2